MARTWQMDDKGNVHVSRWRLAFRLLFRRRG